MYPPLANNNCSYYANGVVLGRSVAKIYAPATLVFLQESQTASRVSYLRPVDSTTNGGEAYSAWLNASYGVLHFGGENILYVDGHVKWAKQGSVCEQDFGLVPNASLGPVCGTGTWTGTLARDTALIGT
jgi:prepilin-type processing-associated H-X9-DG protein